MTLVPPSPIQKQGVEVRGFLAPRTEKEFGFPNSHQLTVGPEVFGKHGDLNEGFTQFDNHS